MNEHLYICPRCKHATTRKTSEVVPVACKLCGCLMDHIKTRKAKMENQKMTQSHKKTISEDQVIAFLTYLASFHADSNLKVKMSDIVCMAQTAFYLDLHALQEAFLKLPKHRVITVRGQARVIDISKDSK